MLTPAHIDYQIPLVLFSYNIYYTTPAKKSKPNIIVSYRVMKVTCEAPLGSILGPLLFILYRKKNSN